MTAMGALFTIIWWRAPACRGHHGASRPGLVVPVAQRPTGLHGRDGVVGDQRAHRDGRSGDYLVLPGRTLTASDNSTPADGGQSGFQPRNLPEGTPHVVTDSGALQTVLHTAEQILASLGQASNESRQLIATRLRDSVIRPLDHISAEAGRDAAPPGGETRVQVPANGPGRPQPVSLVTLLRRCGTWPARRPPCWPSTRINLSWRRPPQRCKTWPSATPKTRHPRPGSPS